MGLIRTYLDAGVLIAAARSATRLATRALDILDAPDREFVVSDYLELELMPKARYYGSEAELLLYEMFFNRAVVKLPFAAEDGSEAIVVASRFGLGAFDALHLVAACKGQCTEFITTERRSLPIFRYEGLRISSISL